MSMPSACSPYTLAGTEVYLTGLHWQPCDMIADFPIGQRRPQDLLLNDSLLFQNTVAICLLYDTDDFECRHLNAP